MRKERIPKFILKWVQRKEENKSPKPYWINETQKAMFERNSHPTNGKDRRN